MAGLSKYLSLCLVVLLASTLLLPLVNAQSIPKPSVPEFSVSYVDLSYDVPTTTSINQYTGQTETHQGYHVENETIQLKIRNQPFTSYIENGQNISFYYNVREKGSYITQWIELYSPDNGYPTQSRTEYTTITFVLGNSSRFGYTPPNSQIDFQVQALIGSVHRISNITGGNQPPFEMFPWVFDGQKSNWSNTKTVTIPASSSSVTPTSSPTFTLTPSSTSPLNTNSELTTTLTWLIIGVLVISVISLLLYVRHLKRGIKPTSNNHRELVFGGYFAKL